MGNLQKTRHKSNLFRNIFIIMFAAIIFIFSIIKDYKTGHSLMVNSLKIHSEGEIMKFDIGKKPKPKELPKQTPLQGTEFDENGIIKDFLPNGTSVYNVFEVANQVILGEKIRTRTSDINSSKPKGLKPELTKPKEGENLDSYQIAALQWLIKNKIEIGNEGAYIWHYNFDNSYNDVEIKAPWPSAFGQAYVIRAFITAYKLTNNHDYLNYALKASLAYNVPLENGGFKFTTNEGDTFFEEMPVKLPTHILNGHLVCGFNTNQ
ncbi:D-glucuronyl C5-epimerase family protein [Paenibacillus sp. TAF58]